MMHVYYAHIKQVEAQERFEQYLNKMHRQRREKILRCKNEKDKARSLLAGILICHALEEVGYRYERLNFCQNEHGKPMIEGFENMHFSVSHAGEYVMCVVADFPVGVDLEYGKRPLMETERLNKVAGKCFTQEEWDVYETCEEPKICFLKLWTRKESYSKAVGQGLGLDFSTIDVLKSKQFVSDWLTEDYYFSVYAEGVYIDTIELKEWKHS